MFFLERSEEKIFKLNFRDSYEKKISKKKDVTTCEKLCGDGRNRRSRDIRMGEPGASKVASSTFAEK